MRKILLILTRRFVGLRMGVLYDITQCIAGYPLFNPKRGCFEFWIDWKRKPPSVLGEDNSDIIVSERIQLHIDYTISVGWRDEPRLEEYFKSLAAEDLPFDVP